MLEKQDLGDFYPISAATTMVPLRRWAALGDQALLHTQVYGRDRLELRDDTWAINTVTQTWIT